MKDSRKKWRMLSIQNRLKKGFRFTTVLTALAGVIAIIVMGIMSTQYSDALKYYGFSQGDIGKAMVTFTETRSCTRGLIGYTDPDVLSTLSENHDTKKESFEKYWSEVGDTVKTKAEAKIYDDVNSKLEDYWKIDEEIKNLGMNAADSDVQKQAEQRASAELHRHIMKSTKVWFLSWIRKLQREMHSKPDWVCCRSLHLFLLS